MGKRMVSLLLALVMIISTMHVQVLAFSSNDVDGHWSSSAIEKCFNYGIMCGYNGYFRPDDTITRAEFASLVNDAFNYTSTQGAELFSDVPKDSWYYSILQAASAQGYFKGTGRGKAFPDSNISREDAFCILARIIHLSGTAESLVYSDSGKISSYAVNLIAGLTKAGYLKGSDGKINPKGNLSRGEAAQVLSAIFGEIADGDLSGGTYENLTVRKQGVTLDGVTVRGDLFVTSGVESGVTLNNVSVNGRLLVSVNRTIKLSGGTTVKELVLTSTADIEGSGKIEKLVIHSGGAEIAAGIVDINNIVADKDIIITVSGVKYISDGIKLNKADATAPKKGSGSSRGGSAKSELITGARFNGLTNVRVEAEKSLMNLTKENILIKKSNGTAIKPEHILGVEVSEHNPNVADIRLDRLAFNIPYSPATVYDANEKFSEGATIELTGFSDGKEYINNTVVIKKNGAGYSVLKNIMTSSSVDSVSSWLNINPAVRTGKRIDEDKTLGQIGTIRATMIVIDDPGAKAEDNEGLSTKGADMGNRTSEGKILKTADDYYDYFVPAAKAFLQESSYGLLDMDVKLVKASTNNGIYRLSGDNASTYPAARGGNIDTYLNEALQLAKNDLKAQADNRDVLYVVAAENFYQISYGPTDVHGGKLSSMGLSGYGALVRIGQDSYESFKKKAFIHELGHDLGLPDLYTDGEYGQIEPYNGKWDYYPGVGYWGIMGYINSPSHDFLGWDKLQFGWIRSDQVDVVKDDGETIHEMTASSVSGGTKLIAIPGDTSGVTYIVEYKRAAGVELPPIKETSKPKFENEGILIYKVDANSMSMQSPITVVNLFADDPSKAPTEAAYDTLTRSVLGPKSGIYSYEDKAAGIVISVDPGASLPEDVTASYTVEVKKTTPAENERRPVLSDAHFLDFTTIECRTSYDMRGIRNPHIKVLKDGSELTGVRLNRVAPGMLRVIIGANQINSIEDMKDVQICTGPFSFFKESNKADVGPAIINDVSINLSDAKFESLDKIILESDTDLSELKASDYEITKSNGTIIPKSAYTVAYANDGKSITINITDKSYFITGKSTDGVTISTKIVTNYIPASAKGSQMLFGAANGVKLTPPSTPAHIVKFDKPISDVSFIAEPEKLKYAVGDVMNFSEIKVKITYKDETVVETGLSLDYLNAALSGNTDTLGNDKEAVFDFGDEKTIIVKFDVVTHPLNVSNRYYGIEVYNYDKQLEFWSWDEEHISTWSKYATGPLDNGAFYLRPTSWHGDTNKNLYEIYKGSLVLGATEDPYITQMSLPENNEAKKATSWQIVNLSDGTYAIVNAGNGKAFAYLGEESGDSITITDYNPDKVKDTQKFEIKGYKSEANDYISLKNEISKAQAEYEKVEISADGNDVPKYKKWVTQADSDIFTEAIKAAKNVIANDLLENAEEIAAAVNELSWKIISFVDAQMPGNLDVNDYGNLEKSIALAKSALDDTVADQYGTNCPFDKLWVTNEQMNDFEEKMNEYEDIINNDLGKGAPDFDAYLSEKIDDLKKETDEFCTLKKTCKRCTDV